MSLISMMEARLPPGFRFHPRDDELVLDYLSRKLSGGGGGAYGGIAMVDVDLNKREPWELPDEACVGGREWYFFSLHDRKYATGQRTNRATRSGYWKATGKDRPISISGRRAGAAAVVGMRKTLVFYQGRAPRGSKTEWVMHEFRVEGPAVAVAGRPCSPLKEDWVLCRVFYKSRTTTARPASTDEAASLSSELISLPLPHMPPADAYLAFDHGAAAAIDGYYQQQGDAGLPALHHQPTLLPLDKGLSSFGDLLSSMVEGSDGGGSIAKAELHQDWTEAAYAQQQQQQGGVPAHGPQAWNPFLSSG
ncbi:hypothetical protein PAHAL_7G293800 [Panicum hallii]|jgi:hypothetical protein|uniref:NAC domain-containing protein n=1 Tax=Panicum hallii TaxID=206008 RepID=A0A2S3IAF0_9POAL|nr:NAC domain-containing protein 21/22-like [Panicum hallii]PAN40128.1 hypothetical protein PAHAL_7G293800 [Panicum hallii]